MNYPAKTSLYQTSDLGTAIFLFSIDHNLDRTSLSGPIRLICYLKFTVDIETEVERYLNGLAQAPARRLFEAYLSLWALAFKKTGNLRQEGAEYEKDSIYS